MTPKAGKNCIIGCYTIICEDVLIGDNVRIGDFVKLMPGTEIGDNVRLDDYVNTSGYCHIGNNVVVKRGTMIGQATYIEDDVWFGSLVSTTRIRYPKIIVEEHEKEEWIRVKSGAMVGSRALLLAGITIGEGAVVGAGSVVTRDCEPYGIYIGHPAKLRRYRDVRGKG